ncbi:energy-coupling factor ABC transporter ATP-binding protein [Oceanobacillus neutriphilus]|uniref:ABC transporter ATP-binding protein n=1 Tax=Oceanobacillus neutriphilus TaxID=531815 RepID=A0ABQ2NV05_9BACI|nr:ABC transporter ATP-binding protein [Oceanobacillus neutriphilus]GGP11219.1 ABC transporter ATP-binding protein [Oceanobacillus neutriphilus]
MDSILKVEGLSFKYSNSKEYAIRDISFEAKQGEILCVVGANGSGKSTICNALVGLIPHYIDGEREGTVKIFNENTAGLKMGELVTKIGLVFQNPFNQLSYTTSTVEQELAYGLGNIGVPRDEMVLRIQKIAKRMRIDKFLHKNPLELSGGQVQRVALGSSIVMDPDIIVLDECTSQLDPMGSEEIFDIIKDLNQDGKTIILVDHDMEKVARIADRVMVLHEGELAAIDTTKNIFGNLAMENYAIAVPDFTQIGLSLQDNHLYNGEPIMNEQEAIAAAKKVLYS